MLISIVVPVLNEEETIVPLHKRLKDALGKEEHEIIFIDDGSTDATAERVKELIERDRSVRLISFQRNFGKAAALSAAFSMVKGDIVFTMDGDLQDDPKEIPRFLNELSKGYDMVSGWKKKRHDPLGKRVPSKFFNWLTGKLTGLRIHDFNCGFKAYRRRVVEHINLYGELHRYIPALAHWHGFSVGEIVVEHHAREFGKTKYGISRLFSGFMDLITVSARMKYSGKPFHIFVWPGLGCMFFGGLASLYVAYLKFLGQSIGNRPILILAVLLLVVGVQFFSLGLLTEMMTSTRSKQHYIVKEEVNP